ncbi:MAG: molybdopterin cofactor-binding domain-containing protein, partial [Verrucomicrobiota bacterium]
ALLTHAVMKSRCAVELQLTGSPLLAGKRHEAQAQFEVGFNNSGKIHAIDLQLALDGGWFVNDSTNALDRALLHGDAVYAIPHLNVKARLCRTNQAITSSLAAEGAAQATWAMEEIMRRVAHATDRSVIEVRERNFYSEDSDLKTTPYGQPVNATAIHRVWNQVLRRSHYEERSEEIQKWNRKSSSFRRGLGIMPIKFGIGDPRADRNAAAVIVQILGDGSVAARVGLVDLNDGFDAQIREEVASHLGVEENTVHVVLNDFESLPRATPVIGTDAPGLVLRALADACRVLQSRLREVALQLFAARGQTDVEQEAIRFQEGFVGSDIAPGNPLLFKEVIEGAWKKRVNLIETGYHRTPNLWWDPELGAGWPFTSFTYAAVVTEIQLDLFTGEVEILRLDVAHEGSPSPNQGDRDHAQLMRAFTLGADWLLSESNDPESSGELIDDSYPSFADAPFEVVTDRMRPLGDPPTVAGSPCSEAPVILAGSIREALCEALSVSGDTDDIDLLCPFPASPPAVISALREISKRGQKSGRKSAGA